MRPDTVTDLKAREEFWRMKFDTMKPCACGNPTAPGKHTDQLCEVPIDYAITKKSN